LELLLRALKAAIRRCALKLDIVGDGDHVYKEFLMQLTRELGLDSVVTFLPPRPRDQLPSLYQQADVFCFPTLCDTYGIALLEAMSCGCAVLVSDVAGAGEIVDGENGLKVPLRSPEQYIADYAGQIIALAQNRAFRRDLGEKARRFILREHDWDRIGGRLLEIYRELGNELEKRK
jgi:glycosyltransferase involved in cell wall biosynthesis